MGGAAQGGRAGSPRNVPLAAPAMAVKAELCWLSSWARRLPLPSNKCRPRPRKAGPAHRNPPREQPPGARGAEAGDKPGTKRILKE
jgi:hypothetical protein